MSPGARAAWQLRCARVNVVSSATNFSLCFSGYTSFAEILLDVELRWRNENTNRIQRYNLSSISDIHLFRLCCYLYNWFDPACRFLGLRIPSRYPVWNVPAKRISSRSLICFFDMNTSTCISIAELAMGSFTRLKWIFSLKKSCKTTAAGACVS